MLINVAKNFRSKVKLLKVSVRLFKNRYFLSFWNKLGQDVSSSTGYDRCRYWVECSIYLLKFSRKWNLCMRDAIYREKETREQTFNFFFLYKKVSFC